MLEKLEAKISKAQKEIYSNLNGWQKVQLSRHPNRPHSLYYIHKIFYNFIELHGDRYYKDDKAIVGDRKSTRLNSSHVAISYAVFCLKKKTHHYRQQQN